MVTPTGDAQGYQLAYEEGKKAVAEQGETLRRLVIGWGRSCPLPLSSPGSLRHWRSTAAGSPASAPGEP